MIATQIIDYQSENFKAKLIRIVQEEIGEIPFSNVYYILKNLCSEVEREYFKYVNAIPPYPEEENNKKNQKQNQKQNNDINQNIIKQDQDKEN